MTRQLQMRYFYRCNNRKQQDANEVLTSGSWDDVTTDGLTTDLIDTGVGSASTVGQWVQLTPAVWAEVVSIPNSNTVRVNGDRTEIVAPSAPYVIAKSPYANLAYSTAGQWTAESFASGETTLTDTSATFASYMVGWQIILDMEFPVAQVITAVPSATTLKVAGDVRNLCDPGKFYILFAPPKVDAATGTLADIITEGEEDDWGVLTSSLYLWAGCRYVPPMVGYYKISNGTTVGAQAGTNKLGNYHCNNRVYSIGHGRWLSPDQAKNPYWNLFDYCAQNSLQIADAMGLDYSEIEELIDEGCLTDDEIKMVKRLSDDGWKFIDGNVDVETDCGVETNDKEGYAAVDNQWRVDLKKKEIELDYSHDKTGCVQLRIALGQLNRWDAQKKQYRPEIPKTTKKCIDEYKKDLSTPDIGDFNKECLNAAMIGVVQVALAGASIYVKQLWVTCVSALNSPPTASLKAGLPACATLIAIIVNDGTGAINVAKTLDACRKK